MYILLYTWYCCDIESDDVKGCHIVGEFSLNECPVHETGRQGHCTISTDCINDANCVLRIHPEECAVTTCRTKLKVRKGGDFFYGKPKD